MLRPSSCGSDFRFRPAEAIFACEGDFSPHAVRSFPVHPWRGRPMLNRPVCRYGSNTVEVGGARARLWELHGGFDRRHPFVLIVVEPDVLRCAAVLDPPAAVVLSQLRRENQIFEFR